VTAIQLAALHKKELGRYHYYHQNDLSFGMVKGGEKIFVFPPEYYSPQSKL